MSRACVFFLSWVLVLLLARKSWSAEHCRSSDWRGNRWIPSSLLFYKTKDTLRVEFQGKLVRIHFGACQEQRFIEFKKEEFHGFWSFLGKDVDRLISYNYLCSKDIPCPPIVRDFLAKLALSITPFASKWAKERRFGVLMCKQKLRSRQKRDQKAAFLDCEMILPNQRTKTVEKKHFDLVEPSAFFLYQAETILRPDIVALGEAGFLSKKGDNYTYQQIHRFPCRYVFNMKEARPLSQALLVRDYTLPALIFPKQYLCLLVLGSLWKSFFLSAPKLWLLPKFSCHL